MAKVQGKLHIEELAKVDWKFMNVHVASVVCPPFSMPRIRVSIQNVKVFRFQYFIKLPSLLILHKCPLPE